MAEKIVIDIFRLKTADQLSKAFAEQGSKLEAGSAAAVSASHACALAHRAALMAQEEIKNNERLDYMERNLEIVRNYMVFLIDEDVKSRGPIHKAMKIGTEREIEACIQPATCIPAEIINMMGQCLGFMDELCVLCPKDTLHYLAEAAELAMSAIRGCRIYILNMLRRSTDETYIYVTKRENEIALEESEKLYSSILAKTGAALFD